MGLIYHLTTHEAWNHSLDQGQHTTPSLKSEGFIHCSTKEQVLESANKHFEGQDELVCLEIVDRRVKPILKWEESRGGSLFPHLYGPLPLEAVERTYFLSRDADGKFEWDV